MSSFDEAFVNGRQLGRFGEGADALKVVVDREMDLTEAQAAHEVMERNENVGKIVLVCAKGDGES